MVNPEQQTAFVAIGWRVFFIRHALGQRFDFIWAENPCAVLLTNSAHWPGQQNARLGLRERREEPKNASRTQESFR
ncbi:hypothetical protein SPHV1_2170037 [Novosphingobium sp. KN65.2]|nr:hypothetical protein SPHV1_2170037 [Novosphingobium sp. KN65.2]